MKRAILFPTLCSTGFALFAILIVIYIDHVYRLAARMCPNPWMENPISETQGCKGYIWKPYFLFFFFYFFIFFFFYFSYENQVILIWYTSLLSTSYHFMIVEIVATLSKWKWAFSEAPPPPTHKKKKEKNNKWTQELIQSDPHQVFNIKLTCSVRTVFAVRLTKSCFFYCQQIVVRRLL